MTSNAPSLGYLSKACAAVRVAITEIGKHSPTGDYYTLIGGTSPVDAKSEHARDEPNSPEVLADPYGLISRWRLNQKNPIECSA